MDKSIAIQVNKSRRNSGARRMQNVRSNRRLHLSKSGILQGEDLTSKKLASNYTPVSLTSIVCKILETIIKNFLVAYMKDNNLFSKNQSEFISGRSTACTATNPIFWKLYKTCR